MSNHSSPSKKGTGTSRVAPVAGVKAARLGASPLLQRGFTLAELLVVIAIIGLILGLVIPGVSSMWSQRLESQAENTLTGLLRSVQVQARANGERGLLFYLEDGVQKAVIIQSAHANPGVTDTATLPQVLADCFEVVPGTVTRMPAPYRVVPRELIDSTVWPAAALDRTDRDGVTSNPTLNTTERHRNFFSVVFAPDGGLMVGRDVLIYDPAGLTALDLATVTKYFDGVPGSARDLPLDSGDGLDRMVAAGTTAVNFPSVDGLLVYDDSMWVELPKAADGPDRRDWIGRTARPYYISRLSGAVIRGPIGEN